MKIVIFPGGFLYSLISYVGLGQFNEAMRRLYSLRRKTMCHHVLPFPRPRQQARCLLGWWPCLCLQSLLQWPQQAATYPKLLLWGGGQSGGSNQSSCQLSPLTLSLSASAYEKEQPSLFLHVFNDHKGSQHYFLCDTKINQIESFPTVPQWHQSSVGEFSPCP